MKKTLMTLALAMGLGVAVSSAQTPEAAPEQGCPVNPCGCIPAPPPCGLTPDSIAECTPVPGCFQPGPASKKVKKGDCKGHKKGHKKGDKKSHKKGMRPGAPGALATDSQAFKGIELTPAQQAEINSLGEDRATDNKKIAQEIQKKRQKMTEKYNKKLQKILTPEQYAQYLENAKKVRRGGVRRAAPGNHPDGVVGPIVRGPEPKIMTD
ncbi:MAG: hypothetical protein NC097_00380 [Clostridium sp.]|nr:hypothetical protein [Prevotella sp.]MCM1428238.1 hypothetical protein [Clostridium sp.]MCM1474722.1 hypothetical protein [Muribaculaceae bacterium]